MLNLERLADDGFTLRRLASRLVPDPKSSTRAPPMLPEEEAADRRDDAEAPVFGVRGLLDDMVE